MRGRPKTLSVVMPVYNERATLPEILDRVLAVPDVSELIVVDDGSTDGSPDIVRGYERAHAPRLRFFPQSRNRGKGMALRAGFREVTGDLVLVQDADLEYDPADIPALLRPIREGRADVVYGSRFASGAGGQRVFWHTAGNRMLTWLSNVTTRLHLTDMETGYKLVPIRALRRMRIRSPGFEVEAEITAKLVRRGYRIREVPISYRRRTFDEGKKIKWTDGVRTVWVIATQLLGEV